MWPTPADVAELVDALVSGTSGSNVVGVQVSPSASLNQNNLFEITSASEAVTSKQIGLLSNTF
jgi:hypothetical protein